MTDAYQLEWHSVPDVPKSTAWIDHLRWGVAVMDGDDKDLGFIASLLAHACKGGLTEKQARYANRILDRVKDEHASGYLDCQQAPEEAVTPPVTLQTANDGVVVSFGKPGAAR